MCSQLTLQVVLPEAIIFDYHITTQTWNCDQDTSIEVFKNDMLQCAGDVHVIPQRWKDWKMDHGLVTATALISSLGIVLEQRFSKWCNSMW